jgi:hypothetical protein
MEIEMWVTVERKQCDLIGLDVALEERRVFPAGRNQERECYQVQGKRCTADVVCNLAGIHCQWAYTNPGLDRFHPEV